jgi:hypothetical protein
VLVLGVAAGCPQSAPPPAAVAPDLAAAVDAAVAVVEPAEPRSLELGMLRQPVPAKPSPDAVYAVAEFPLHTPPLQDGTADDRRLVEIYCVGCHSTTYISMQPPLPRAKWEAEVKKMIAAYGAVIPEPVALRIATYLHAYYGDSPLPPRKRPLPGASAAVGADAAAGGGSPGDK